MVCKILRFLRISLIPFLFLILSGIVYFILVIFIEKKENTQVYLQGILMRDSARTLDDSSAIQSLQDGEKKKIIKSHYLVVANIVNVRAKPSIDSAIVHRVYKNEVLMIEHQQNSWGKIEQGYIFLDPKNISREKFLKLKEQQEKKWETYRVVADIVNIRLLPSANARLINRVYKGDIILIETMSNNWGRLQKGGYVFLDLVEKISRD